MVSEYRHPIRSAITVAGILGHSASSARICRSCESTTEPCRARSYFGGRSDPNAAHTVLRVIFKRRAISLIETPSARYRRRISAQSFTLITPPDSTGMVNFHPSANDQFSPADDIWPQKRREPPASSSGE